MCIGADSILSAAFFGLSSRFVWERNTMTGVCMEGMSGGVQEERKGRGGRGEGRRRKKDGTRY